MEVVETCATCKFMVPQDKGRNECRRRAPVLVPMSYGVEEVIVKKGTPVKALAAPSGVDFARNEPDKWTIVPFMVSAYPGVDPGLWCGEYVAALPEKGNGGLNKWPIRMKE